MQEFVLFLPQWILIIEQGLCRQKRINPIQTLRLGVVEQCF